MSWGARAVPGHGHPAIHNIPPFWACLVSSISTSYPLQLCLKASRDVPKVFNSSGGGGGGGISGPPTLRFNHRAMAFLFCPTPSLLLSLSLSFARTICVSVKKKASLTRGTFLLHLAFWWRQHRGLESPHIGNTFTQAKGQCIAFPWSFMGRELQNTFYT